MTEELVEYQAKNTPADNATQLLFNPAAMQQIHELAKCMASSKITVPKHLQGSPADCMAIIMQSARWGMDPFAVAQKTHLVNGNLGYEAQLVNAVVSSSHAIRGRFQYRYSETAWPANGGKDDWVQVGAVLAGESSVTWGEKLYPAALTVKNSPLWKTSPKQQAGYVAVKYWARLYCPDVILGVYTREELDDMPPVEREVSVVDEPEALPPYSVDDFKNNFPKWQDAIEGGKATSRQIISKLETVGTLTDEQRAEIAAIDAETEEAVA